MKIKVATGRQYSGVVRNVLCNDPGHTNCTVLFNLWTSKPSSRKCKHTNTAILLVGYGEDQIRWIYAEYYYASISFLQPSLCMRCKVTTPFIYYRFAILCLNPSMFFLLMGMYCVGEMPQWKHGIWLPKRHEMWNCHPWERGGHEQVTKALFPQSSYHTLGLLHLEERVHLVSLEEISVATKMSAGLCCNTMCGGRGQSWCLHITIIIPNLRPKHPSLQLPGVLAADWSQLTSLGESNSATFSLQVAFVD